MKKTVQIFKLCFATLVTLLVITGCSLESKSNELESSAQVADSTQMLSYLTSLGFDTSESFEEDGNIVVEGDIAFNKEALQSEIAQQSEETSRQYAHGYLVRQSRITYVRIKTTGNVTTAWSNAVNTAISDWNGIANCKIRLVRVASNATAELTISRNSTSAGYVARASFPNGSGNPGPTINVNPKYDYYTSSKKRHVMVHEIGHCLGMRHINNNESERIQIPGTPVTDNGSIMHPYVKSWSGFSAADLNAAQYLYPSSGQYIVVYEHANYTGKRWVIRQGTNEANANRFLMNDKISSIKCYGGAKVTVYQHSDYRGASMTILGSVSNLSTYDFNDTLSSIKWTAPTGKFVIVYKHSNYTGRAITITGNNSNFTSLGFNDQLSSIKVFNGAKVRLYQHSNYRGTSLYTTSNKSSVGSMNDQTSSIRFY